MINFAKARYVISAPDASFAPKDAKKSILFIGRTNVGKSTLLNKLTGQKISYVSKKAGKTKYLNFFLIDDSFYLVDAPGYGSTSYATVSTAQFSSMMESFLPDNRLVGIFLLLDLRRDMGKDDLAFLKYLQDSGKPVVAVLTKVDLMNQSEKSKAKRRAGEAGLYDPILSDGSTASLNAIKKAIDGLL